MAALESIKVKRLLHLGITKKERRFRKNYYGFFALIVSFSFFRLKFYEFLLFLCFFVSPFPRSPYFYTAIARQPTISALNQASPKKFNKGLGRFGKTEKDQKNIKNVSNTQKNANETGTGANGFRAEFFG